MLIPNPSEKEEPKKEDWVTGFTWRAEEEEEKEAYNQTKQTDSVFQLHSFTLNKSRRKRKRRGRGGRGRLDRRFKEHWRFGPSDWGFE